MHAVQIRAQGGPEVLESVDVADPVPGPGEVALDIAAAGLNYIDTYHRSGLYPLACPAVLGLEAAGTVTAVGDGVTLVGVGDRVAYTSSIGSYAERRVIAEDVLVPVPDGLELETAAALMLQGLTAYYLVNDTWPLQAGQRCLVHAGAGGVGLLLIQLAKAKGAEVFATVGSDAKSALASGAGADHVIVYSRDDFVAEVEAIGGDRPIDVVYDGVGQATFAKGLSLLRRRGMMVTFGNASGPVEPVSPLELSSNGSIFLTRPTLFDYVATRDELVTKSNSLFAEVEAGTLDVRIGERIPLAEARRAHEQLEGRATTGKILLIP